MSEQIEGLAAELLTETSVAVPPNALVLARVLGFKPVPVGAHEESFDGRELHWNARAKPRDQHEAVMRVLARWKLEQSGFFPTEATVAQLTRAVLLPRQQFVTDLRTARGMEWLMQRYPHASAAVIGARLADVGALKPSRPTQLSV